MYMAERRDAEVKTEQRKETAASKHSESAIKTTTENAVVLFSLQHKILVLKYAVFLVAQLLKPKHNNLLGSHNLVIH